jgi:hypothetical protein
MRQPNPFMPPEAELEVEPPPEALKPLGSLVPWMRGTGYAEIGFTAVSFVLGLIGAGADPEGAFALVGAVFSIPAIAAGLAEGLVLFIWVYRAVKAANALREAPQPRGPGLTVASFILPIVSFYWPYQSIKALFQASDPADPIDYPYAGEPSSSRIPLWWAAKLLSGVISQAYLRLSTRAGADMDDVLVVLDLLGDGLDLIEIPLSIWIVREITARVLERARRLGVPLR